MILLVVALLIPVPALGARPLSKLLVPAPEPVRVQSIDALGGRMLRPVLEQVGKAIDEAVEAFWRVIGKGRDKKTMSPDEAGTPAAAADGTKEAEKTMSPLRPCCLGGQRSMHPGADMEARRKNGKTPLDVAKSQKIRNPDQEDEASVIPAGS